MQKLTNFDIDQAVAVLKAGGLVVYPTDTVYGLAVDATNSEAVSKLLQYKQRPAGKAISVLVSSPSEAKALLEPRLQTVALIDQLLPGPFTIVGQSLGLVDPRLESEFGTLGVRVSPHPVATALAKALGSPITATSANAAGKARPYALEKLYTQLTRHQLDLIGAVLDGGVLPNSEPSTVIDTTQEVQTYVRSGAGLSQLNRVEVVFSVAEMQQLARRVIQEWAHALSEKPLVICLEGEMGSGKTHFAKGIGEWLNLGVPVVSPSYTLVKQYQANGITLYHLDCWRLSRAVKLADLGLEAMLVPGAIVVVEWPGPILAQLEQLGQQIVLVKLLIEAGAESETQRKVSFI